VTRCPLCDAPLLEGAATVDLTADEDDTGPHPATVAAHATCWRVVEAEDLLDAEGLIPACIADLIWECVVDYPSAWVEEILDGIDPREVAWFRQHWGVTSE
jgi:hypothetical protein